MVRGPYLQSGSSTGMVVRWRTDLPTESVVRFRVPSTGQDFAVTNRLWTIEHEVRLAGLSPDTTYLYSVGDETTILSEGADHYFRTSPANARPVRVWAIGDSGTGNFNQWSVRDSYLNHPGSEQTDVWLMLGDNVYEFGTDEEYQRLMFDIYPQLLRHTVLWPALGNHDIASSLDPLPYVEMFTLPAQGECGGVPSRTEHYYSFDHGNIHFVCIDSALADHSAGSAMLAWLKADLAATSKDWIIAYWHHPPYSMGSDFSDTTAALLEMREAVVPILETYGTDLVLCGHSHVYERSFLVNGHYGNSWTFSATNLINGSLGQANAGGAYLKPAGGMGANRGTVYVVCGCSGQGGVISFERHPAMAVNLGGYGSFVLDIDGLRLEGRFLRPSGEIDDFFTLDKSVPITTGPRLTFSRNNDRLEFSWPTSLPEFALERSPGNFPTDWDRTTPLPTTAGRRRSVQLPITNAASFFRLRAVP